MTKTECESMPQATAQRESGVMATFWVRAPVSTMAVTCWVVRSTSEVVPESTLATTAVCPSGLMAARRGASPSGARPLKVPPSHWGLVSSA